MYIDDRRVEDWGVVTDVAISSPSPRLKKYTVPGRQGEIDATEALTGYVVYDNRELKITLSLRANNAESYTALLDDIYRYCHGRNRNVTFDFDDEYYYQGRLAFSNDEYHKTYGKATITGSMFPYALKEDLTVVDISSETADERNVILSTAGMPTKLTIETDAEITITRGDTQSVYSAGTHIISAPLLLTDEAITVEGAAVATISYQEGKL